MPAGSSKKATEVYSKGRALPWAFNTDGHGKVEISSASAGFTLNVSVVNTPLPTTGGGGGGGGKVTIVAVSAGIANALPVAFLTTQPISVQGTANVSITNEPTVIVGNTAGAAVPVSVQGTANVSITNQPTVDIGNVVEVTQSQHDDLQVNANVQQGNVDVGSGNPLDVDVNGSVTVTGSITASISGTAEVDLNATAADAQTVISTGSASTETVISAPGSGTAIRVKGFSICNESTNVRRFELRFGATAWWKGSLAAEGGAFNWNMIGHNINSAANKALIVYINGAGTATVSVYYKTFST